MQKSTTAWLAVLLSVWSSFGWSQSDLKLNPAAPERYTVEKGDTLWGIAKKFLEDPWRWPEIWRMNEQQIRNPHRIHPGDVIVLERGETPPRLRLVETEKLSPKIYTQPLPPEAIPPISPSAIEPFLTRPLIIEPGGLDRAPRIVATQEGRVNVGAGSLAYATGLDDASAKEWQVYRPGKPLVDPDSQETLGFEAIYLGTAQLIRKGDPATIRIVTSKQEISAGDRLIPAAAPKFTEYVPHAPTRSIRGRVIGLYDALATSEGGRDSVVSINRGARDGLEPGDVLAIYRSAVAVDQQNYLMSRDSSPVIRLPDERYGLMFLFRVFSSVSYGLVLESSRPVQPGDVVQNP